MKKKYRKLESKNENLKADMKKLRRCKALNTKVMNMAACGKQEKREEKNETNL